MKDQNLPDLEKLNEQMQQLEKQLHELSGGRNVRARSEEEKLSKTTAAVTFKGTKKRSSMAVRKPSGIMPASKSKAVAGIKAKVKTKKGATMHSKKASQTAGKRV